MDIINQTRTARENDQTLEGASGSPKALTKNDFQDIISKTENENNFEDILNEVIDKYLKEGEENDENEILSSSPPSTSATTSSKLTPKLSKEEIPIINRLRPRTAKKKAVTECIKKANKKQIKIISNEVISVPLSLPSSTTVTTTMSQPIVSTSMHPPLPVFSSQNHIDPLDNRTLLFNLIPIMPQNTGTVIPWQSFASSSNAILSNGTSSNLICDTALTNVEIPSNIQIVLSEKKKSLCLMPSQSDDVLIQKTQHQTPKMFVQTNFVKSKCNSTPRRKQQHIRILDFNQTPSLSRLSTVREFTTPSNGIRLETPGSAPASITAGKRTKEVIVNETNKVEEASAKDSLDVSLEVVDESSNSTSISNTPKVVKNRRRRKIEIDSKKEREESPKPMTRDEWNKMREEQKTLSVDDRMRILFQQQRHETVDKVKKRKTPKKKQDPKKSPMTKVKKKKTITSALINEQGKKLLSAKFKVTSPRKAALLRKTPKKSKAKLSALNSNKIEIVTSSPPSIKVIEEKSLPKLSQIDTPIKPNDEEQKKCEAEESIEQTCVVEETSDLNRSDTVQEVAKLLTNLPETILAKTNSFDVGDKSGHIHELIDSNILMETPLKFDSMSPLPNTPRFAVPLVSIHQETPLSKLIINPPTDGAVSILKVCEILTPNFPITPGFKETPPKTDPSPSFSAEGYTSRKTDYSSCSSYYKPDESEEINRNLDLMIKQRRESERNSQSESDGGCISQQSQQQHHHHHSKSERIKINTGSGKKIQCPGALDKMLAINEEANKNIPEPHYTMMDEEALLSESFLTTASSDESSSSFTCSTCSTDPSSDEDTLNLLNKSVPEDRDSEWHCDDPEIEKVASNNSLIDSITGEVRFPLRSLITPKKIEPTPVVPVEIEEAEIVVPKVVVEKKPIIKPDLEAIKARTLRIIKDESKKNQPRMRKSNAKTFKLPPEQPKAIALTRRDQILQQNLSERPRPTPLKLIASTTTSTSSSRRKNATPRKTIIIDELPKAPSPIKKAKKPKSHERRKSESPAVKTPMKPERVTLENINDNAVSNDDHPSLNISTSFHESSLEDEEEVTVVQKPATKMNEESSNTFQSTLITQGFDKTDGKDLQTQFVDKIEEAKKVDEKKQEVVFAAAALVEKKIEEVPVNVVEETNEVNVVENKEEIAKEITEVVAEAVEIKEVAANVNLSMTESETEDDDDVSEENECDFALSNELDKNIFSFQEQPGCKAKDMVKLKLCAASKLQIDERTIRIDFSETTEIFSMEPTKKFSTNIKNESRKEQKSKAKETVKSSE